MVQRTSAVSDISIARARARKAPAPAARQLFIDNIRSTMIILVVSMHAAVTYSPVGRWYYMEKPRLSVGATFALVTWQAFLQAFFMGFLFFIAGYFVPPAFDRKGGARFIKDRAFRLGLPVLFYVFILGPFTEYYVAGSWRPSQPSSFAQQWLEHIRNGEFLSGTGPMWFCEALLIFCASYLVVGSVTPRARPAPTVFVPDARGLLMFAIAMGAATFLVRIVAPSGSAVLNLQLADFPQYVLLFVAGIYARRGDWLSRLSYGLGIRWLFTAIVPGFIVWCAIIVFGGAFSGSLEQFGGGLHWQSAAMSAWEAMVCVGMCAGLTVLYRRYWNTQGRVARFLSDNAFSVYVFHPPIVIAAARMLHGSDIPPLAKVLIVTILGVSITYGLSALIFRRIPLLRTIV